MRTQQQPGAGPRQEAAKGESQALPIAAACTGYIIWGFSYLFTRIAQQVAHPDVLLSIRFILSFLLANLLILFKKGSISFKGKNVWPALYLGVSEGLYFYLESYGILHTNSTFAGVVLAIVPVVSIGFSSLFLKEYPTKRQAMFCIFPVVGVILMTISGSSMGVVTPLGVILLLLSTLVSASNKAANRKASKEFSAFERTYLILLSGTVMFTIKALITVQGDLRAFVAPLAEPRFLWPVLVLSIFCSYVANMVVNYAAGKLPIVKISSFVSITTLVSIFAGAVFLGEPLTALYLIGAALIIFGIWQITRRPGIRVRIENYQ